MTRKPSATPTAEDISRHEEADAYMLAAQAGVEAGWLRALAAVPSMARWPEDAQAMMKEAYSSGFYAGVRWVMESAPATT